MSRAIELAKRCGITIESGGEFYCPRVRDIEAFYHAARAEALREAADWLAKKDWEYSDELLAMADREGK